MSHNDNFRDLCIPAVRFVLIVSTLLAHTRLFAQVAYTVISFFRAEVIELIDLLKRMA